MNPRRVLAIARKDFLDALRNARLLVIVLMPIGFSVLYGYLFRDTPTSLEVVLYSPDPTVLTQALGEVPAVSLFVVDTEQAVEQKLELEKAKLGVILPSEFDLALRSGARPEIRMIYRENPEDSQSAERLLLQVIESVSGRPPVVQIASESLQAEQGGDEQTGEPPLGFFIGLELNQYFVILWVMMGIAMNGSYMVPTLLVEEKDRKTLDAILVTPASYSDVAVGKLLVGVLYSLLTSFVVMALNRGFTGQVGLAAAVVLLASLALTLIGLLIGSLIDNMSTMNTWGGFIILPLMLPGLLAGVPLESLSPLLNVPLQAIPTFQLVRGMAVALTGDGSVWLSLGVLAGECLVLFGAVVWFLRRREA